MIAINTEVRSLEDGDNGYNEQVMENSGKTNMAQGGVTGEADEAADGSEQPSPLGRLVATSLELAANRLIKLDPEAAGNLEAIAGETVGVELVGTGLTLVMCSDGERLTVSAGEEADTMIRGTPSALFAMASGGATGSGRIRIEGDAEVGQRFQQFIRQLDPDWEEPIARLFGDTAGHQIARMIRGGFKLARNTLSSLATNTGEYFTEESRDIVGKNELEPFLDEVDDLRDRVDRLAQRIAQLTPDTGH